MSSDAYNLEFDAYFDKLFRVINLDFFQELNEFSIALLNYVIVERTKEMELYSTKLFRILHSRLPKDNIPEHIRKVGDEIVQKAQTIKPDFEKKIADDFPKFIGSKTNYWRYLLHLIPEFTGSIDGDYTQEFIMANACLLELNFFCFMAGQLEFVEDNKMFWMAMFLHFFGERFDKKDKRAFLEFHYPESKKETHYPESKKETVEEDMKNEEKESTSKKTRKKHKKRNKK